MLKESLLAWGQEESGITKIPLDKEVIYVKNAAITSDRIYLVNIDGSQTDKYFDLGYSSVRPWGTTQHFYFDKITNCLIRIAVVASNRTSTSLLPQQYTVYFEAMNPNTGALLYSNFASGYSYNADLNTSLCIDLDHGVYGFYFNGKSATAQVENHRVVFFIPSVKKLYDVDLSSINFEEEFPASNAQIPYQYHYSSGFIGIENYDGYEVSFKMYTHLKVNASGMKTHAIAITLPSTIKYDYINNNEGTLTEYPLFSSTKYMYDYGLAQYYPEHTVSTDGAVWHEITEITNVSSNTSFAVIGSDGDEIINITPAMPTKSAKISTDMGATWNTISFTTSVSDFLFPMAISDINGDSRYFTFDNFWNLWSLQYDPDSTNKIITTKRGKITLPNAYSLIDDLGMVRNRSNEILWLATGEQRNSSGGATTSVICYTNTDQATSSWSSTVRPSGLNDVKKAWIIPAYYKVKSDNLYYAISANGYISSCSVPISTTHSSWDISTWSTPVKVLPDDYTWIDFTGDLALGYKVVNSKCVLYIAKPSSADKTQSWIIRNSGIETDMAETSLYARFNNVWDSNVAFTGLYIIVLNIVTGKLRMFRSGTEWKHSYMIYGTEYNSIRSNYLLTTDKHSFSFIHQKMYSIGTTPNKFTGIQDCGSFTTGFFYAFNAFNNNIRWTGSVDKFLLAGFNPKLNGDNSYVYGRYSTDVLDTSSPSLRPDSSPQYFEGPIYDKLGQGFVDVGSEHLSGTIIIHNFNAYNNSSEKTLWVMNDGGVFNDVSAFESISGDTISRFILNQFQTTGYIASQPSTNKAFAFYAVDPNNTGVSRYITYVTLSATNPVDQSTIYPVSTKIDTNTNTIYLTDKSGYTNSDMVVLTIAKE